jgi:hypothetical protein
VVFIIDDLTRAPDAVRQAVLAGAQAVRLRHRTCGVLMTAQLRTPPARFQTRTSNCWPRLLAIALDGGETDGMSMGSILDEIKDLANPLTRSAVERYVARANPSTWFSAQEGMDGIVRALGLLAADDIPLPDPADSGAADPAWRASLALVISSLADADTPQPVEQAWAALLDRHRDVVASLLLNLR